MAYDSGCYSLFPIPIVIDGKYTIRTQRFDIMIKDMVTNTFKYPLYEIKGIIHESYSLKIIW